MLAQQRYIILDNIRSAYNVGAIFRTAEGADVKKIFLSGYTPRPIDRFGRKVAEIQKTSLSASELVPWESNNDIKSLIIELKNKGVQVVAVELADDAIPLYDFLPTNKVAYIFGNEVTGIAPGLRALCDSTLEIPMRGKKESLNVATAVGVVLFYYPKL